MALISKPIPNLINGVSQQPPSIRNPTQCELQENMLSDVTYGVCHRPNTEYLGLLASLGVFPAVPYFHTIDRGPGSQYKVMVTNGDLKVFDLITGAEKTVAFPDGKAYLTATDPKANFQAVTLGLETYILNRQKVTNKTGISTRARGNEALVFIKQGDYSTDYTVTITVTNTNTLVVTGPVALTKTTSATVPTDIKTTQIATDIKTAIDASAINVGVNVTRSGSVLWIYAKANYTFKISVEDSKGNNNARLIRQQIQKFADLPTVAPTDYEVQVVGDKTSGFDDYYVVFVPDDPTANMSNGAWAETWHDGYHKKPDPITMPLVLTDNQDGTFTCAQGDWAGREAGDELTNPDPSFIGKALTSLFTFGNRLGVLCEDRVIMSEVGQYTNFFLTTVITFLDSDPIDIKELNGYGKWLYAVPLAEKIILFSTRGQAVVKGDGLLTPKTATLKGATLYPVAPSAPPVLVGDKIVFTALNGDFTRVYEYYPSVDAETFKASDITSHVPKYIPTGITRIAGDESSSILIAMGCSETAEPWYDVWVYKYFWLGDQKVQSSWSRWMFPRHLMVVDVTILDEVIYFVSLSKSTGAVIYHSMDLDITKDDSLSYENTKTHLDFRMAGSSLPSVLVGTTRTFTLPFPFGVMSAESDSFACYRRENQVSNPRISWGVPVTCSFPAVNQVSIEDPDGTIGDSVWFGFPYTSTFTLSEIHIKEDQNGSQIPTEVGKLTIKKIELLYNGSLYFRVEVTPHNRDTNTYVMTPFIVGDPTALRDVAARSGRISIPVNAANDKVSISVINDSVVRHRLQSAEWTGNYAVLSQRT